MSAMSSVAPRRTSIFGAELAPEGAKVRSKVSLHFVCISNNDCLDEALLK
jgi:hypothetical protein